MMIENFSLKVLLLLQILALSACYLSQNHIADRTRSRTQRLTALNVKRSYAKKIRERAEKQTPVKGKKGKAGKRGGSNVASNNQNNIDLMLHPY